MGIQLTNSARYYLHTQESPSASFVDAEPSPEETRALRASTVHTHEVPKIHLPGLGNIVHIPLAIIATLFAWLSAKVSGDEEAVFDARLRLAGMPLSLSHAISSTLALILQLGYVFHISLTGILVPVVALLSIPTIVFGFGVCLVEGVYKSVCVKRAIRVLKHRLVGEGLNEQQLIANLDYFRAKYLAITDKEARYIDGCVKKNPSLNRIQMAATVLQVKRANLERRVRPWCAEKIEAEVEPLLRKLTTLGVGESRAKAGRAAEKLLNTIEMQGKKTLLIHSLALTAVILSGLGFLFSLIACPPLIPFILMTMGGILSTITVLYGSGTLDQHDWSFSWMRALPFLTLFAKESRIVKKPEEIELSSLNT